MTQFIKQCVGRIWCRIFGHRPRWVVSSDPRATSGMVMYRCRVCGAMVVPPRAHFDWSPLAGEGDVWHDDR